MFSTKNRFKFNKGERVLCYDPNPTRVKILYESEVLDVIENKRRGRCTIEYVIKFHGLYSPWVDRVRENFVLKDTKENRQLQRDLDKNLQLKLDAYRRKAKKDGSDKPTFNRAKRTKRSLSDDDSSTRTKPHVFSNNGSKKSSDSSENERDSESSLSSSSSSSYRRPTIGRIGRANNTLPLALKNHLTSDYNLVVNQGKLSRLPASPCVAEILESFLRWFVQDEVWRPPNGRRDTFYKPDILDVNRRLNLMREVADGLRFYFDVILREYLLYNQELGQYHEMCGKFTDQADTMKENETNQNDDKFRVIEKSLTEIENELQRLMLFDYPCPFRKHTAQTNENIEPNVEKEKKKGRGQRDPDKKENIGNLMQLRKGAVSRYENEEPMPSTSKGETHRYGPVSIRIQLRRGAMSRYENEEPMPSTSKGEPHHYEPLSYSESTAASSVNDNLPRVVVAPVAAKARTPLSLILEKVANWQVIPRQGTQHLPCRVYGAIHLARLFVKLPEFLNTTKMPNLKLQFVLKHFDMFVRYLDEHVEWFGETYYYVNDGLS